MFSINLIFIDAKKARVLNKKYRHLDKVATVLSFYYGEEEQTQRAGKSAEGQCLGEVVICLSEAKKQNLTIEELVSHGFKNLLSQIPTAKLK